jgi:uncharacterized protein
MTAKQIDKLLISGLPQNCYQPELIETHISWVILCDHLVYKIKKPVHYSFIDFSTLEQRKYYCEKEIVLNKRITDDIYLDVQPISEKEGNLLLGSNKGNVIDYAVRMRRVDREKQMDYLLQNNKVTPFDIQNLAQKIAGFHKRTTIITLKDVLSIRSKFNDLEQERDYLSTHLQCDSEHIIDQALKTSNAFLKKHESLLEHRLKAGYFRDCHGDLHSRNIFLLPDPQPFDCIEFNDDYRQIDVLNEIAFLCMDLDAFGRHDLSELFFNCYNSLFPTVETKEDYLLFVYYKSYRSNIRAKVNSLRARSAINGAQQLLALKEAEKYLQLMNRYINELKNQAQ